MRIIERFNRLTFWNKIGAIGAICSILALIPFFVPGLFPQPDSHRTNVTQGIGNNIVNTGDGTVTVNDGDINIRSFDTISKEELQQIIVQERRDDRELSHRDSRVNVIPDTSPSEINTSASRRFIGTRETAGDIIEGLTNVTVISEYRQRASSLYEGRWLPDPGWSGVVFALPEEYENHWLVSIREDGSDVIIFAITDDESGGDWRDGQNVAVVGRIKEVRYNPFIYVDHASITAR